MILKDLKETRVIIIGVDKGETSMDVCLMDGGLQTFRTVIQSSIPIPGVSMSRSE